METVVSGVGRIASAIERIADALEKIKTKEAARSEQDRTGVNLEDFVSTLKEDLQDALSSQKDCHTPFDSRGNLEECGEPMNKPD